MSIALSEPDRFVADAVDVFGREFPDLAVTFEATPVDGGFQVRREHCPTAVLTVEPHLAGC